jgi:hypothetical protein
MGFLLRLAAAAGGAWLMTRILASAAQNRKCRLAQDFMRFAYRLAALTMA